MNGLNALAAAMTNPIVVSSTTPYNNAIFQAAHDPVIVKVPANIPMPPAPACPSYAAPQCSGKLMYKDDGSGHGCLMPVCSADAPLSVGIPPVVVIAPPVVVPPVDNPLQYVPSSNPLCDSVNADPATAAQAGCVLYGNTNPSAGQIGSTTVAATTDMTPWLWLGGGLLILMLMRHK